MRILKVPEKMTSPTERRGNTKYCDFHIDHEHDTEQYIELQKEIKNTIREGPLKDFIAQQADHRQEHRKKCEWEHRHQKPGQQLNAREHKEINIISIDNRKQTCRRQRQEEDDALLVVTFDISRYTIKRVLVDMESAANVLFKDAFNQMGIPPGDIEPRTMPLVECTGRCISSISSITLPLTIEGHTPHLDFLIIDAPSLYNSILGHPILNTLKATISTYSATVEVQIRCMQLHYHGQ